MFSGVQDPPASRKSFYVSPPSAEQSLNIGALCLGGVFEAGGARIELGGLAAKEEEGAKRLFSSHGENGDSGLIDGHFCAFLPERLASFNLDSSIVEPAKTEFGFGHPVQNLDDTNSLIEAEGPEEEESEGFLNGETLGKIERFEKILKAKPCLASVDCSEPDVFPKNCCTCKKSRCLKLYCECFARGGECSALCSCHECLNSSKHAELKKLVVEETLARNPQAFIARNLGPQTGRASSPRGCGCKRSGCRKKYCECFSAGLACSEHCRCRTCANEKPGGVAPLPKERRMTRNKKSFIESLNEKLRILKHFEHLRRS